MPRETKKITKSELREDQFVEWILKASDYVQERLRIFAGGAAGVVVLMVVVHFIIQAQESARLDATERLGSIKVAEQEGRIDSVMILSERLIEERSGTPAAAQAVVILANRYFIQGRYADAQRLFQVYLDDYGQSDILTFAAWRGSAACLEAQGQLREAAGKYQEYAAAHPDNMQAALALLEAARCYGMAGEVDRQKSILDRIIKEFGASPVAARARDEINML